MYCLCSKHVFQRVVWCVVSTLIIYKHINGLRYLCYNLPRPVISCVFEFKQTNTVVLACGAHVFYSYGDDTCRPTHWDSLDFSSSSSRRTVATPVGKRENCVTFDAWTFFCYAIMRRHSSLARLLFPDRSGVLLSIFFFFSQTLFNELVERCEGREKYIQYIYIFSNYVFTCNLASRPMQLFLKICNVHPPFLLHSMGI